MSLCECVGQTAYRIVKTIARIKQNLCLHLEGVLAFKEIQKFSSVLRIDPIIFRKNIQLFLKHAVAEARLPLRFQCRYGDHLHKPFSPAGQENVLPVEGVLDDLRERALASAIPISKSTCGSGITDYGHRPRLPGMFEAL